MYNFCFFRTSVTTTATSENSIAVIIIIIIIIIIILYSVYFKKPQQYAYITAIYKLYIQKPF